MLTRNLDYYDTLSSSLLNSTIDYGSIKDENGNEVTLNTGNYGKYLNSSDRAIRKNAYDQMNSQRIKFANILGDNLLTFMNYYSALAKVRGFKSTKEMNFKMDVIPTEVHESLLKNIKRGLPLFQKYNQIRKKVLGLNKLEWFDLSVPIISVNKEYTIEEATDYVYSSLKILGEDYLRNVKKGFDERWIDFMPYKGKQSGGYCTAVYGNTPNILLSFNGKFTDISTISHEMGHAINFINIFANNGPEYADTNHYVAEVASLSNELLLANYILSNDFSKEEKILALDHILLVINNNFFDAVLENELEEIVYKKIDDFQTLNYEDLNKIAEDLNKEYYGDILELGDYVKYRWITRSHYFTPWYLYKYATCMCAAVYFVSRILKGDQKVLSEYKEFLKIGVDHFPNEILLNHGIDLTDSKIYDEFFVYYESLIKQLEKLVK